MWAGLQDGAQEPPRAGYSLKRWGFLSLGFSRERVASDRPPSCWERGKAAQLSACYFTS